ncbi:MULTISPECIES: ComF family protein [unclassified Sphingomonas]|uniref:ComF family protein n=1 Tax=unclassified Sphingomonas TaxID=196159 RepID=UPI0006F934C2|nr:MULTISPECIES: ComF family protein [unclassified Sphingomonas]KQM28371.1 amidophosphoribosyltransferase [Sphingomonas sp. Leaf9]KQM45077.1 amidophosphoribosyltransferase [Sphingomonas sp. Leaf11]
MRLAHLPAAAIAQLVALAIPPRCPGCGVVVEADHRFCAGCWTGLRFLGDPACAGCGAPMAVDQGPGMRCAPCLHQPPVHDGVRAAVAYGPVARDVALKLKYGGRLALATTMARLMARHLAVDADCLIPVPLHRRRLWSRGYNQSVLIAAALGRMRGLPVLRDSLRRTRPTPPLRGMSGRARAKAVRGAFVVDDPAAVAGRSVVLIDDVHTSGATVDACTNALRRAGARRVTVLCWARVVGTDD